MKKATKLLALLMAGMLLASGFTSCLKKNDGKQNIAGGNGNAGVDELAVPEGVAAGKEFGIYLAYAGMAKSYVAEEETGEDLNDAVFRRNQLTEQYTGAKLKVGVSTRTATSGQDQKDETAFIRTLIQSGDTTYDAFVHVQHSGMPTLVEEGLFVDWNEIPHINLNNSWWYSNVQRDICFGDKIYYMTGDYNLDSFSGTECLIFNKTMCDEIGIEYPYQLVFDGKWTHDEFVKYIKAGTKDLNGDGQLKIEDDRYGFGGWQYEQLQALYAGYGGETIIKDENNLPVVNIDNERTYTVVDKMLEVFDCEGAFFEGRTYGTDHKMFREGRLLFRDAFISNVPGTRGYEQIDVGFVPYPKLDEDQQDYYSRTANISCLTYIPVTNSDLDKTGAFLETLAYYGNKEVLPTYFDIILTIKSTRDVESEQMIPIIRNSSRFLDQIIGFSGSNIVTAKSGNTLSSYIAANEDKWDQRIETLVEFYEE